MNYNGIQRPRLLLRITLSDITRFVELEEIIDQERKIHNFIINALKSRQEIGYFIERTQLFLKRLKLNGFTPYHLIDLKEMFNRYNGYVLRLSQETQKSILPLQITGESIKVNPEKAENVLRVLVAIFRNAIVHGIEMPEERTIKNKDSFGQIYCRITQENQWIHISIGDDGQGIDRDFIVKKAVQYGMIGHQQSSRMTEEDKLNLIFESGMSRLEDADILAGRCIGLYTVREVINKMGGEIQVTTTKNRGTEFNVFVPMTELRTV